MTPRPDARRALVRLLVLRAGTQAGRALSLASRAATGALELVETDFDRARLRRAAQRLIAAAQELEAAINALAMLEVFSSSGSDHV